MIREVTVNTSAEIVVASSADVAVFEGRLAAASASGVHYLRAENGARLYLLESEARFVRRFGLTDAGICERRLFRSLMESLFD